MKKILALIAVLVFAHVSSVLAQPPAAQEQLNVFFSEVVEIEGATAAGEWGQAQRMTEEIKRMMLEIAPSVRSAVGEHAYKALLGFVVQLQEAVKEKDRSATAGPLVSLQKMNGWLAVQ